MSIEAEVQNNTKGIASLNQATADLKARADRVEDKIPGDASQTNKLATREWVKNTTGLRGSDDGKTVREVAAEEIGKAQASSMNVKLLPPCHLTVNLAAPSGSLSKELYLTKIQNFKDRFNVDLEPDTVYISLFDPSMRVHNYLSILDMSDPAVTPVNGSIVANFNNRGFTGAKILPFGDRLGAVGLITTVGDNVYFSGDLESLP